MLRILLLCGAACLPLTACSDEPPQIPADIYEAGQFCTAAKMLSMRDANDTEKGKLITISQAAQQKAYSMIAASRLEDFATFIAEGDLVISDKVVGYGEEFEPTQFDQLVAQCDAYFGISGGVSIPTLPTDNIEAIYSCFAASHSLATMASQPLYGDEGRGPHYRQLMERMAMHKNRAVSQREGIGDAEANELFLAGLKHAFSQGNIMNYVAACDARFRD